MIPLTVPRLRVRRLSTVALAATGVLIVSSCDLSKALRCIGDGPRTIDGVTLTPPIASALPGGEGVPLKLSFSHPKDGCGGFPNSAIIMVSPPGAGTLTGHSGYEGGTVTYLPPRKRVQPAVIKVRATSGTLEAEALISVSSNATLSGKYRLDGDQNSIQLFRDDEVISGASIALVDSGQEYAYSYIERLGSYTPPAALASHVGNFNAIRIKVPDPGGTQQFEMLTSSPSKPALEPIAHASITAPLEIRWSYAPNDPDQFTLTLACATCDNKKVVLPGGSRQYTVPAGLLSSRDTNLSLTVAATKLTSGVFPANAFDADSRLLLSNGASMDLKLEP